MDITVAVFVISMVVVGLLLTANIRRDFVNRKRLKRDVRREVDHARARAHRRTAHRP